MNKIQKLLGLLLALSFLMPAFASAQVTGSTTVDVQVQALLNQITSLEQQLRSLVQSVAPSSTPPVWNASSTPPGLPPGMLVSGENCSVFSRNLAVGSRGDDVMQLQQMLAGDGFLSASSTGFFGPLTVHALAAFQAHFGIAASSSAKGFFGPLTRNFFTAHCGDGRGEGMMGSSTPPVPGEGTSTWPMPPGRGPWMGTSTDDNMMGPMGSSTGPRPCPPDNGNGGGLLGLFVPHAILPVPPCGDEGGPGPGPGHGY
jgi:peptidoglycan hydrolase-like protein with peptidoglycan-binding domain